MAKNGFAEVRFPAYVSHCHYKRRVVSLNCMLQNVSSFLSKLYNSAKFIITKGNATQFITTCITVSEIMEAIIPKIVSLFYLFFLVIYRMIATVFPDMNIILYICEPPEDIFGYVCHGEIKFSDVA